MAREALGRPLTAESKNLLWTANETLKETQAMLFYGRGNIETDVRDSDGESSHRILACRNMQYTRDDELTISAAENNVVMAAIASRARAGNCAEYKDVAVHLHAIHLGKGDRIVTQFVDGLDHEWARVQCATPVGGAPGSGPAAVLDAWADGPVVEPTDSRHASGTSDETNDCDRIDSADGAATYEAFQLARNGMREEAKQMSKEAAELRASQGSLPITGGMHASIPVVSDAFASSARNAIDSGSPTTLLVSAVGALLESPTPPTREQAEAGAAQVVSLARELDVPFPWPRNAFLPIDND